MISLAIIALATLAAIITGYFPLLLLPLGICIGTVVQEVQSFIREGNQE